MTSVNFRLVLGRLAHGLLLIALIVAGLGALPALAASGHVSEANLVLPDLSDASLAAFFGGASGWSLLFVGLLVCLGGLVFGGVIYYQIVRLPVHRSMAEVSELIYETCKTCLLYTSPSPRDRTRSRMPSSA